MLYAQWRTRGVDPVSVWRRDCVPAPPDGALRGPWPDRVDAFLTACANHAADRERDLMTLMKAFASKG